MVPAKDIASGGYHILPMKKNAALILVFAILGFIINLFVFGSVKAQAETPQPEKQAIIYFFWGDGCPHCAEAEPHLQALVKQDSRIILKPYEVWYDEINQKYFVELAKAHGFEPSAVPTIFLGDKYWVGYSDQILRDIESTVDACLADGCPDAAEKLTAVTASPSEPTPAVQQTPAPQPSTADTITLPLIGEVDLSHQSLFINTLLISFVDGVNPCSIWVLTMLLALTMHTGSRKKIIVIGSIFIFVTAAIYALFILGLFSVMSIIPYKGVIQIIVAIMALVFGIINIKDYFWYKEGVSLTISDDKKPGIYKKMRNVVEAQDSYWGLSIATVVLAAGVSLVEFSCTAGFPVIWTNMVNAQHISWLVFAALLLVYMIIYQLDEMIIFFSAVFTLKASKLEEKGGRILKLVGGVLMLCLAVVMILKPELMNELSGSLIVFGIAALGTILILLLHRTILPAMGVHIGTEFTANKRKKKH